jgi:hypothetical protein
MVRQSKSTTTTSKLEDTKVFTQEEIDKSSHLSFSHNEPSYEAYVGGVRMSAEMTRDCYSEKSSVYKFRVVFHSNHVIPDSVKITREQIHEYAKHQFFNAMYGSIGARIEDLAHRARTAPSHELAESLFILAEELKYKDKP